MILHSPEHRAPELPEAHFPLCHAQVTHKHSEPRITNANGVFVHALNIIAIFLQFTDANASDRQVGKMPIDNQTSNPFNPTILLARVVPEAVEKQHADNRASMRVKEEPDAILLYFCSIHPAIYVDVAGNIISRNVSAFSGRDCRLLFSNRGQSGIRIHGCHQPNTLPFRNRAIGSRATGCPPRHRQSPLVLLALLVSIAEGLSLMPVRNTDQNQLCRLCRNLGWVILKRKPTILCMLAATPCAEIRLTITMGQFNLGLATFLTAEEVMAILLAVFFGRQDVLRTNSPRNVHPYT